MPNVLPVDDDDLTLFFIFLPAHTLFVMFDFLQSNFFLHLIHSTVPSLRYYAREVLKSYVTALLSASAVFTNAFETWGSSRTLMPTAAEQPCALYNG
jgi:hypothetical protein